MNDEFGESADDGEGSKTLNIIHLDCSNQLFAYKSIN